MKSTSPVRYFIGLMSGTSLDGVDGVLMDFSGGIHHLHQLAHAHRPFSPALRATLLRLQQSTEDELAETALAANLLASVYAEVVHAVLAQSSIQPDAVCAIGCHGQTIRHQPTQGYTIQIGNLALLAELTGIDVIGDFRSRDIAAGGQGAPLVPAFHQALFAQKGIHRAVVNIGGMSNVSLLFGDEHVQGFDCGPGNVFLDSWIQRHQGQLYDAEGAWAETGRVQPLLLERFLKEPFFHRLPPKSTGRDVFNDEWLAAHEVARYAPEDVQATLTLLSAYCIADSLKKTQQTWAEIFLCGGGVYNKTLMRHLSLQLECAIQSTAVLGVNPQHVEAIAFAWLAYCFIERKPANLPEVTGAKGHRILGALYPA